MVSVGTTNVAHQNIHGAEILTRINEADYAVMKWYWLDFGGVWLVCGSFNTGPYMTVATNYGATKVLTSVAFLGIFFSILLRERNP